MWSSFTDWLEQQVREKGLVRILGIIGAAFAVLAAVGIGANQTTLLTSAAIALIAVLLVLVVAQYLDRLRLYSEKAKAAVVLDRYADELRLRQTEASFDIIEWREEQSVRPQGDTSIDRYITIRVGSEPLQMFWQRCSTESRGDDFSYRSKVQVSARYFEPEGTVGVDMPVTTEWDGHSLRVFMHFYDPPTAGQTFRVQLHLEWPRYSRDLVKFGAVLPVEWILRRKTERLAFSMRLNRDIVKSSKLAVTRRPNSPQPDVRAESGGDHVISWEMLDLPRDERVGFWLQIRN